MQSPGGVKTNSNTAFPFVECNQQIEERFSCSCLVAGSWKPVYLSRNKMTKNAVLRESPGSKKNQRAKLGAAWRFWLEWSTFFRSHNLLLEICNCDAVRAFKAYIYLKLSCKIPLERLPLPDLMPHVVFRTPTQSLHSLKSATTIYVVKRSPVAEWLSCSPQETFSSFPHDKSLNQNFMNVAWKPQNTYI